MKNIICSGVSVGSMESAMIYLRYMYAIVSSAGAAGAGVGPGDDGVHSKEVDDALQKLRAEGIQSKFPICERNGVSALYVL
jgi:hypothetical protein